jgi:hypothetical protein
MLKNFRFKYISPLSLKPQEEARPFSSIDFPPNFSPHVDNSFHLLVFDSICGVPQKKKKLYEASRKFQNTWTSKIPWVGYVFNETSLKYIRSNARYAHLLKGNKNY